MRPILSIALPFLIWINAAAQDEPAAVRPIIALTKIEPNAKAFEDSGKKKPLALKSEKEAAKYFEAAQLKKLEAQVDFEKQVVLVFAWKGSGQDKMTFEVAESFPEQITFKYQPGRTRDLRPHVKIYALRSNVKWSVKDASNTR